MSNKILRYSFLGLISLLALYIAGQYLPEKLYEWIGKSRNTNILVRSGNEMPNQKRTSIFMIAFAILFFLSTNYSRLNRSLISFILAVLIVFVGYFIGVYLCFVVFEVKSGSQTTIDIDKALNIFIVTPLIILMIVGFTWACKHFKIFRSYSQK